MDNRRPQPVRIVIADDHPIFRDGLRRLLEAESDLKVIGEACDGTEAVKMARQLKPDIMLLDLAMPRMPGLEALRELSTGPAHTVRVILLTAAAEKKQIVEALQLGARGVVLKDSATQLLLKSIHTVMSGEYWVGRESVSNLVQYSAEPGAVLRRRGEAEEIRAHTAGAGDCFRRRSGLFQQGNRGILQDQRRYGETSSQQYLRQAGGVNPPGTGPFRGKSGLAAKDDSLRYVALWCYVFPHLGYWQL